MKVELILENKGSDKIGLMIKAETPFEATFLKRLCFRGMDTDFPKLRLSRSRDGETSIDLIKSEDN